MEKLMIVGKQKWNTQDRETGEPISGLSYVAILANGTPIKFTSQEEYPVHTGKVVYDPALAVEVNLLTRFFGGKISYQDGKSYGRDVAEV